MKHLDLIQLTDYIRGATAEAQAAAMEAHLASGCQKCRLTADLLHKLAAAARSDSQVQVPDYALRCARAIFLLQQPEKVQILPRIPARLLYDSFREPLPAGLRTQQRLSRQTLYQAGDYSLDLRLENERGSSRVALVGQIENRNHPEKRVSNVPTASILDSTQIPRSFGHGTMVAGIIHLVAPTAQIMPLKAFTADGSSNLFDILRAIYFAVDHGAQVINMSFSFLDPSQELMRAVNFASGRGVICVSSTGNLGKETLAFPASFQNVVGVASTNNLDMRSTFSSFGAALADMAAPGEGIITTFPGKHYAAAWGTSFSTPFVSGAAALLVQVRPRIQPKDAFEALAHAKELDPGLGWGRLDLYNALFSRLKILPPGAPAPGGVPSAGN